MWNGAAPLRTPKTEERFLRRMQLEDRHRHDVERAIESATGRACTIVRSSPLAGGCINDSRVLELEDGGLLFLKANPSPAPSMFEAEAAGLRALSAAGVIRVPEVVAVGEEAELPFLVLEFVETGKKGPGYFAAFGAAFAQLHQATSAPRAEGAFGFRIDNYIGSTPQYNQWNTSWVDFWRDNRMMPQLKLLQRKGMVDVLFLRLGERLMERLPELLGQPDEPPCLLHGDLWSGNYLTDLQGAPVLIDPAAYYGRREADLAMTMLFGGFDRTFYDAYQAEWPLEPGASDRLAIYRLYHLLNHMNLFGQSYTAGCLDILRRYGS